MRLHEVDPIILAVLFWFVFGLLGGLVGRTRRRMGFGCVIGFLLGPIGVLLVALMPDRRPKCPMCASAVNIGAIKCRHCGSTFERRISGYDAATSSVSFTSVLVMLALALGVGAFIWNSNTPKDGTQSRDNLEKSVAPPELSVEQSRARSKKEDAAPPEMLAKSLSPAREATIHPMTARAISDQAASKVREIKVTREVELTLFSDGVPKGNAQFPAGAVLPILRISGDQLVIGHGTLKGAISRKDTDFDIRMHRLEQKMLTQWNTIQKSARAKADAEQELQRQAELKERAETLEVEVAAVLEDGLLVIPYDTRAVASSMARIGGGGYVGTELYPSDRIIFLDGIPTNGIVDGNRGRVRAFLDGSYTYERRNGSRATVERWVCLGRGRWR